MAIKLEDKPSVEAPSGDYPYGNIKDDSGPPDGTPVNKLVYADFHQFFARLLAMSGIVANGLPDNNPNTFQYFLALLKNISYRIGVRQAGIDLDAEKYAGIFNIAGSDTNVPSGLGTVGQLIVSGKEDAVVIQRVVDIQNGFEWTRTFTAPATWSAWTLIRLGKKVMNLGDWNMDTNLEVLLEHGLPDHTKIISIDFVIYQDPDGAFGGDSSVVAHSSYTNTGEPNLNQVYISRITSTHIGVQRTTGSGTFDSTTFNLTPYNRGRMTIEFAP